MFAKELIIFGTQIDPFFYSRAISMAQGMGSQVGGRGGWRGEDEQPTGNQRSAE